VYSFSLCRMNLLIKLPESSLFLPLSLMLLLLPKAAPSSPLWSPSRLWLLLQEGFSYSNWPPRGSVFVLFCLWYSGLNSGPKPWATQQALFFSDGLCLGWLPNMTLLISASWVARITDVSHRCPARVVCFTPSGPAASPFPAMSLYPIKKKKKSRFFHPGASALLTKRATSSYSIYISIDILHLTPTSSCNQAVPTKAGRESSGIQADFWAASPQQTATSWNSLLYSKW
jgi:hypothetical protein